jgi:hypothetical protein
VCLVRESWVSLIKRVLGVREIAGVAGLSFI